jgi:protein disulfide-isomerase A6
MKEDWNTLGDEFADSSSVLIGDVDCTSEEGKDLCDKFDVKGYPTIKYFVDGDMEGQDYQGGRDYDSLLAHATDNLSVKCDVTNPVECTDKEKAYIEKMKAKTAEDRSKQIHRLSGMLGESMKAELKQWLSQRLHILLSLEEGKEQEL